MQINKVLRPLVTKFVEVNNYVKMKAILDIGISGIEVIEKHYSLEENSGIEKGKYEIEIKKLKENMNKLKEDNEEKIEEIKKKYENKNKILEERAEKINKEKNEISDSIQEKIYKIREELEKNYLRKIEEKNKNIEETSKELIEYKKRVSEDMTKKAEEQMENMGKIIKDFNERMDKYREEKQKEINILRETMERQNENNENKMKYEIKKVVDEKEEIINELEKVNKRYRDKYEKLEVNSVLKGKPYEDAIEEELKEYFEKYNNNYTIKRRTDRKGKGDFVITNNYSKYRIMLEVKNMPKVSSSVKDQQPKFYSDVRDKVNNYDAGIMISSGTIEGKKDGSFEVMEDGKIVFFLENYNLNNPKIINLFLDILQNYIKEKKNNTLFTEKNVLDIHIKYYNNATKVLKNSKNVYEYQKQHVESLKETILNLFNIDVDEYIDDNKKSEIKLQNNINEEVKEYIKEEIEKNKNIKQTQLKEKVIKKYNKHIELYKTDKANGISKNAISKIVKKEIEVIKINMKDII